MYSVTGQDTPLYSFSALPGDKASVLKSKNAMDEYSMMRLEYYLPAGGPVSGQYTAGRVNALDRSAYGGVSYLESFGNDGNGNASYVGDSAFASDIKKNAYQFPAYSSVGYSGTARTTGYTTFIDRVGGINYLGSHSPPNYGGSCWTTYNDYEYNGPNIDDRVIDSHGRDIVRPNPAQYLVETAGTAYAPVKKFQMTFALNVPVRLFSYSGSQNDYTFVNMLEPTFKGGTMNGDSNGIVYADLNDVKKNRVSTDPANPYALSKVQAGIGRDDPVIFLDKRLQGKVDKIYTERTYLFRESQDINARWCSWNPGSPYQLKRSNLGNVPGSTCGKLYQFLNYDKAQDQEGSLEGNIPDSNGIQGAKIMIRLRIVLKDLSEGEIKSGNDKAQLLLQNGGESMFIMDVPVKYAGAFSSFVENTLLAQDNPGQQFSAIGSDGINALDIKKVNEVIESINNFNSQKFSFFTYGVNMEKKIYTDVTVGHLTQRYSKRTTECCNDDGDCNTSYGIENGSSWFTKTGNKFIDFSAWSGNSFWYSPIGDLLHVIGINNTSDWEYVDLDYDEGNGTYRSMVTAIGNDTNFYGNLYGSGTEVTVSDILDGNNDKKQPSACELFSNGKRYEKIHTADPIEVMSTIENSKYDDGKVRVIEYTGPEIVMLDSTNKE